MAKCMQFAYSTLCVFFFSYTAVENIFLESTIYTPFVLVILVKNFHLRFTQRIERKIHKFVQKFVK